MHQAVRLLDIHASPYTLIRTRPFVSERGLPFRLGDAIRSSQASPKSHLLGLPLLQGCLQRSRARLAHSLIRLALFSQMSYRIGNQIAWQDAILCGTKPGYVAIFYEITIVLRIFALFAANFTTARSPLMQCGTL